MVDSVVEELPSSPSPGIADLGGWMTVACGARLAGTPYISAVFLP